MKEFRVLFLDASTWDLFSELVERDNGIYEDAGAPATTPNTARRASAIGPSRKSGSNPAAPNRVPSHYRRIGRPLFSRPLAGAAAGRYLLGKRGIMLKREIT
jgi:hypothetical protein